MTRRRRRRGDDEEEPEVDQEEGGAEGSEEEGAPAEGTDRLIQRIVTVEKKTEDVVSKLGMVMMEAKDAEDKVRKLVDSFKDIDKDVEELANDVDEKLEKLSDTEAKLDKIVEESEERNARIRKLEETRESLLAELQQLKKQKEEDGEVLIQVRNLAQKHAEQLGNSEEQLESMRTHTIEMNSRVDEIFGTLEDLGMLKDGLANLSEEMLALRGTVEKGGQVPPDLENRLQQLGTLESEFELKLKSLEERIDRDFAEIAPLIEKVSVSAGESLTELTGKFKSVEERFATLSQSVNEEVKKEMAVLKKDIEDGEGKYTQHFEAIEGHINDITEELNQIDDRYDDLLHKQEEMGEKIKSDVHTTMESHQKSFTELQGKIQSMLDDSEGITKRIEDTSLKVGHIDGQLHAANEKYIELEQRMKESVERAEGNAEKVNLASKLAQEIEEKVRKIIAPVDDEYGRIEGFEELPEIGDLGFDLNDLLQVMIKHQASDLHIKEGAPPTVRLEGDLVPVGNQVLSDKECRYLVLSGMSKPQRRLLLQKKELDFAYTIPEARFRVHAFLQRGTVSASFRMIKAEVPSIEELNLPPFIKKLASIGSGLVIITGTAGCGKSTTLASMIDFINTNRKMHIITIEDPIEVLHADKLSLVTQREVGIDAASFAGALRSSLREDANVIMLSEMRDPETIISAVLAAESGRLVLATLHTPGALQAVERMIDVFHGEQQKQFRALLSSTLRAVVAQRLFNRVDGEGRVPAVEMMVMTPQVSSFISEGKMQEIYPLMVQGGVEGMQTFTASLTQLFEAGLISKDDAILQVDRPTEYRLPPEAPAAAPPSASTIPEDSLMSWL